MHPRLAIVYNEPQHSRYDAAGEAPAVLGVLEEVAAVHRALLGLGYDVATVPLAPPLAQAKRKLGALRVDLVFNLFEGFCGSPQTEAVVPEILAEIGTPYTGCPGSVLRLALDKAKVKTMLQAAGIPTPDYQLLNPETLSTFRLGYPCIVKPCGEDASHGLSSASVVHDFAALERQTRLVSHRYGDEALVEKFIDGREFNATILGNTESTVLPVSEISYSLPSGVPRILTFAAKWAPDTSDFQGTRAICPADLSPEEQEHFATTTVTVFRLLGGQGYARVDLRLDEKRRLNVIEVNPNPDISPGAGAVRQAAAAGMTYPQFIEKIVQLALDEKNNENHGAPDDPGRQIQPDANTAPHARIQTG